MSDAAVDGRLRDRRLGYEGGVDITGTKPCSDQMGVTGLNARISATLKLLEDMQFAVLAVLQYDDPLERDRDPKTRADALRGCNDPVGQRWT
jgi:hypothetical protein